MRRHGGARWDRVAVLPAAGLLLVACGGSSSSCATTPVPASCPDLLLRGHPYVAWHQIPRPAFLQEVGDATYPACNLSDQCGGDPFGGPRVDGRVEAQGRAAGAGRRRVSREHLRHVRRVRTQGDRPVDPASALARRGHQVKKYILFDHDGVLVDTELWYYKAGERALADIGVTVDKDQYLRDMSQGAGTWAQARAAGVDEQTISRQREVRDDYYQDYLRTEAIEIEGVVDTLAELSHYVRMAIVTTAKRVDFDLIHEQRHLTQFMDFVLVREDYELAKPHPEPYLAGLKRFGASQGRDAGGRGFVPRAELSRGGRHRLCHRPQRLHAGTGLLTGELSNPDPEGIEGHRPPWKVSSVSRMRRARREAHRR